MIEVDEEQQENGRLYSKDVLSLIFKYIVVYKKYLLLALFFVLIITAANLWVPYLLKTIIDRYVFKQGRIIYLLKDTTQKLDLQKRKHALQGILLDRGTYFLFQSELKYYTKGELEDLEKSGILSEKGYVLVESPKVEGTLKEKVESFRVKGEVMLFSDSLYLFESGILGAFSVQELLELRAMDFRRIIQYVFIIISILLIQFCAAYLQIIFLMKLSQFAMKDLRKDVFSHIISLEVSFYDKNQIGKLVNRVTNDIETLNELFSSVLVTLFQDILIMFGIAFIMFITNLYLAFAVAVSFPFILLLTILFRIKVRNAYRRIRTKVGELNSFLNETITGIRIIQIFVREVQNFKSFTQRNFSLYNSQIKQLNVYAIFRPLISFLRWFSIASVIYFGARGLGIDKISYGLLVMFIAYIERFFAPVQDFSEKFDIMQSATAAGEKILSILKADVVKEVAQFDRPRLDLSTNSMPRSVFQKAHRFSGELQFKDVWFSYNPDEWVLKDVSFSIKPKETLAIVGETGAGKSTITSILTKLYKIQRGQILIDGVSIGDIPFWEIRNNFISVMQDVFLFSRSVRENITLGRKYDEKWFKTVCTATHINRFIENLPNKEEEKVMERGATFSAGERQLLSFARALYFNPSVLVLDEATSSIDTETERLIQDAIINITKGRTSIIIAHRLSTIRHADKIIVLDKGKIVEQGNHAFLLAKKGIYHKLYTLQFSNLL